jgi:DNA-binding transcriptional LysR family regulator
LIGARQALAEIDDAIRKAHEVQSGYRGSLSIGAIGMVTVSHLPEAVQMYRKAYPENFLSIKILQDGDLADALKRGAVDIALSGKIDSPDIKYAKLWTIPVRVVLPKYHKLAGRVTVDLAELSGETLIIHPRRGEGGANIDIMALTRKSRFIPGTLWEVPQSADFETLLGLVACGVGVTFLPASFALLQSPSVVFKEIAGGPPVSEIYASWRAGEPSPQLNNFLACARLHAG